MSAYTERVAHYLDGIDHVSTGTCPGCDECGLSDDPTEDELELAAESHFSWHPCEVCNGSLGGDRYPAHAIGANDNLLHFDICTDCLFYIEYGNEPENWEA